MKFFLFFCNGFVATTFECIFINDLGEYTMFRRW